MTTTERRLAQLEATLTPTERVVRWMAEAHAYGSFEAYARVTYGMGPEALPLDRLAREAADAVRRPRHRASPDTDHAVTSAILSVVFRFQLVLRIIEVSDRFQERAELVLLALTAYLNLVAEKDGKAGGGWPSFEVLRDTLFARVADLHALGEARAQVEARYLAGQPALFPEAQAAWDDLVHRSRSIAMIAWGLTDRFGGTALDEDRYGPTDPDRVKTYVADLVEAAKVKAHDQMGDGRRAVAVAIRWLAPALGPSATGT